jgi:alkaline phosphatase D
MRFFLLFALLSSVASAAGTLVSGPMLGYQTHREVLIWLETRDAQKITLDYHPVDRPADTRRATLTTPTVTPAGVQPLKFVLPLLDPATTYAYSVSIDDQPLIFPYPLTFKTHTQFEWRGAPADFSFHFGSCAYFNDAPYDRPGKPYGQGDAIFTHMAARPADFMLWGGDNLYLREADFSSESGIWYRYSRDRATPGLQPLLAKMPHYAAWDDHDFGPNNANRAYTLAPATVAAFQTYWGNPTYAEPGNPGVYGRFQWQDAVFLLLDNRTHRDDSSLDGTKYPKSQYGARQLDWLKQQLLSLNEGGARRHVSVCFIVNGTQFLSDNIYPGSEGHAVFAAERTALLDFIREHRIGRVVFLTGDVHLTELRKKDGVLPYPLYELTSSPLSSGAHTRPLPPDPARIEGTVVQDQNYCHVTLSGTAPDRVLTMRSYDKTDTLRWTHTVNLADLRWPE